MTPNYAYRVDLPNGTHQHKLSRIQQVFAVATRVRHLWRVASWCQTRRTAHRTQAQLLAELHHLSAGSGLKPPDYEVRLLPCIALDVPEIKQASVSWRGVRIRTTHVPDWGEARPTHVVVGQVGGRWVPELWAGSRMEAEQALGAARQKYVAVEIVDVPAGVR